MSKELENFKPAIGNYVKYRKIWRWEVIGGLCLTNGYRYGAELGVSTGRFTTFLCTLLPDMRMLCVDLWAPQPENTGKETYTGLSWDHDKSYAAFAAKARANFPGRVSIIRDWTTKAAQQVPDESLDFVFIDADHSYEAVKADIAAWTPKIKKLGLLAGHDYEWPGVEQAVNESGAVQLANDNCWLRFIK